MTKTISTFLLHLLILTAVCTGALLAEGPSLGDKSKGRLEAILLIDSSGSMLLTDPNRLRDEGAKLFIQSLKAGDKIGVIEFSGEAKPVYELSEYKSENDAQISEKISKIKNEGIYTDLLSGIKYAQEVFKKSPVSDSEKVIIMFSDGKMDPDPSKAASQNQSSELLNVTLPALKSAGIKVHTLALSEQSDKDLLSQIAASTEGIGIYAADASQIQQAFTNLFLAVKKPQVLPMSSKGFKIDADVQEATFYINKEGEGEIFISSPKGARYSKKFTDSNVKWFSSKQFDVVTIINPDKGDWAIEGMKSQDNFATLLTNLQLVTDWPSSITADEDRLLQVRLYEEDKPVVLHGMSGALEYALQIVPTDKISEPILKSFLNDEGKDGDKIANDGIFSQLIKIDEPGQYKLKVVAHSPTFDRYQHLPFQVKERMVGLSVEKRLASVKGASHAKDSEHGDSHGTDHDEEHHEDSAHGEKEHAKDEQTKGHDEHAADPGTAEEDYFVAKLNPEIQELKDLEVKVIAVDKERNRYKIDMHASDQTGIYEIPTSVLPEDGLYTVEASVSGTTKSKKPQISLSQKISYLLKKEVVNESVIKIEKTGEGKEISIKTEDHKDDGTEKVPGSGLYLGLITIWNLAASGAAFVLFKKASSGPKIVIPEFENVEVTKSAIAKLRDKLSISEVNLNDEIFTGEASPAQAAEKPSAETARADLTAVSEAAPEAASEPVPQEEAAPEAENQPEAEPAPQGESEEKEQS